MEVGQADGGAQLSGDARVGQADPSYTWDALVLPGEQLDSLRAIVDLMRERHAAERGAARLANEPLRPALFLGAAGTGKTMAARIIAAELDAPVRTLDLAGALVNPEQRFARITERAFQGAARVGAVLVIDGAEPLLRRAAPADWHGPHPSVEESLDSERDDVGVWLWQLLERADRHDGLVIVTSTVTHGIDPAVADRFSAAITFPLPDPTARKAIWRQSLPADAQLTESNLDYLAGWLKWPGGTIHRCCLAATDVAAQEGVPVQLRHVAGVLDQAHHQAAPVRHTPTAVATPASSTAAATRSSRRSDPAVSPPPAAVHPGSRTPVPAPVAPGPPPASGSRTSVPAPIAPGPPPASVATSATPPRPGRRWPMFVAAAVAVAVVLGTITAVLTRGTSRSGATRTASAGALRIALPPSWRQRTPAAGPALGLTGELTVASPAPAEGELVIGKMSQADAAPLPPPLLAAVPSTATPEIVKVGRLVFYRYQASAGTPGSATESIYAMPTTAGTVIGVCRPHGASSAFTSGCMRVLATLRLTSGRAMPLTLSTTYARGLNAAISRLNVVRSSAGTNLATATTGRAQEAAAAQLAQAHSEAASALTRLTAGVATAANAALAHALVLNADAYRALAQAVTHHDTHAYSAARADLARSAEALNLALGQLRRLGYRVA